MRVHLSLLSVALFFSTFACTNGDAAILGLSDQTAYVGKELVIELRAIDIPAGESPSFHFSTNAEGVKRNGMIDSAGIRGAALFRWTPAASDIGEWVVDFEVRSRGVVAVETVTISVRATAEGEPVFRRPIGAGVTFNPRDADCLEVPILVEDPDTATVDIALEGEMLKGATIEKTGAHSATFTWCPPKESFVLAAKHVVTFIADDGEHEPVRTSFVIVVRTESESETIDLSGWLVSGTSPCFFQFPSGTIAKRNSTVVLARNASQDDFEEFWGRALPNNVLFIDTEGGCPQIVGGERFSLNSSKGERIDGPSPPIIGEGNLQRTTATGPPERFQSWDFGAASEASPGNSDSLESKSSIYISEISDAIGSAEYQFVELAVQ